jgi:hypothetical protein
MSEPTLSLSETLCLTASFWPRPCAFSFWAGGSAREKAGKPMFGFP